MRQINEYSCIACKKPISLTSHNAKGPRSVVLLPITKMPITTGEYWMVKCPTCEEIFLIVQYQCARCHEVQVKPTTAFRMNRQLFLINNIPQPNLLTPIMPLGETLRIISVYSCSCDICHAECICTDVGIAARDPNLRPLLEIAGISTAIYNTNFDEQRDLSFTCAIMQLKHESIPVQMVRSDHPSPRTTAGSPRVFRNPNVHYDQPEPWIQALPKIPPARAGEENCESCFHPHPPSEYQQLDEFLDQLRQENIALYRQVVDRKRNPGFFSNDFEQICATCFYRAIQDEEHPEATEFFTCFFTKKDPQMLHRALCFASFKRYLWRGPKIPNTRTPTFPSNAQFYNGDSLDPTEIKFLQDLTNHTHCTIRRQDPWPWVQVDDALFLQMRPQPPPHEGIEYHSANGHILALYIHKIPLTTLPSTLGDLSFLRTLQITHISLETLPITIGKLGDLRYIDLNHNQLSSIPNEIAPLSDLCCFNFAHNNLSELPISFGALELDDFAYAGNPWNPFFANEIFGNLYLLEHLGRLSIEETVLSEKIRPDVPLDNYDRSFWLWKHDNPTLCTLLQQTINSTSRSLQVILAESHSPKKQP